MAVRRTSASHLGHAIDKHNAKSDRPCKEEDKVVLMTNHDDQIAHLTRLRSHCFSIPRVVPHLVRNRTAHADVHTNQFYVPAAPPFRPPSAPR